MSSSIIMFDNWKIPRKEFPNSRRITAKYSYDKKSNQYIEEDLNEVTEPTETKGYKNVVLNFKYKSYGNKK